MRSPVRKKSVMLVAMPWALLNRPSIQLGVLQSVLEQAGVATEVRSLYLDFMEHLASKTARLPEAERVTPDDYGQIAAHYFIGDWVFAVPPFKKPSASDEEYFAYLRREGVAEELISAAVRARRLVPEFLDACAGELLAARPSVVGFTTTFGQNVPSLVLSKMLKRRDPSLKIVFGGANCDGPMGAALHRAFPWVDVAVRGEGERVVAELMTDLLGGGKIRRQPGLCFREGKRRVVVEQTPAGAAPLGETPFPVYDEYFTRIQKVSFGPEVLRDVSIPFEASRGCWWGAKQHCTFCGLNGSAMAFRSKTAERAADELLYLARKYRQLSFQAVDNIMDMRYFDEFLPRLRDSGSDLRLFYEIKSNLKRWQVRALREAGVSEVQPGLESLSTPVLRLMRKGVTALQNIRLLKWCAEFGVRAYWNIIYGFPGEPPAEYERMAALMPSLTHLEPPNLIRLGLERFSPYHQRPRDFNLEVTGPRAHYRFAYPCDEATLDDLAYSFEYRYTDDQDPETYTASVRQAIEEWRTSYGEGRSSLEYRKGPDFLVIRERRAGLKPYDYRLGETEARIYLACDAGATPASVRDALKEKGEEVETEEIESFLQGLLEERLVYEEDGRYLSLALPVNRYAKVADA